MTMKRPFLALVGLSLLMGFSHCSDDPDLQYIKVPVNKRTPLTVGQSHDLTIQLAAPVDATTYIDIKNDYGEFVQVVEPASLVIKYRAAEQSKKVTLKALKITPNKGWVPITFQIRDSSEQLTLEFQVKNPGTPDFGLPPDYGSNPDIGLLDTGVTPDQAVAPDAAAPDAPTSD